MGKGKILMHTKKIIIKDGIYHIVQRAPGKELIFVEDKDYLNFLALLKETSHKFSLDVLCFALLPNHLHILIKTQKENLDEAMKYLFQSYAQRFNKKYQRKGHVFCGVYRASLCQDEAYFIVVSLYIHLNPYKAGLISDPFKYKWYSLHPYIRKIKDTFIKVNYILEIINEKDEEKARNTYKKLLEENIGIDYRNILQDPNAIKRFFDKFIVWFKDNIKRINWQSKGVFDAYCELERKIEEIKNKKRFINPESKKALLYLIEQLKSQGYTIEEIAHKLNIGRTTIYRLK
jgi:putative transposase